MKKGLVVVLWLSVLSSIYAQKVLNNPIASAVEKDVDMSQTILELEKGMPHYSSDGETDIQQMRIQRGIVESVSDDGQQVLPSESDDVKPVLSKPQRVRKESDDIIPVGSSSLIVNGDIPDAVMTARELDFDFQRKREAVVQLVNAGVKELQEVPLDVACNRFSHTKNFVNGDLYLFVFDANGTCLAHGNNTYLIWKDLINMTDPVGTFIVQDIIKKAKEGGGWVTYGWHNATKTSYVQLVEKDGRSYIVGSGYFPHSKEDAVVNLVKGGVALFNQTKREGRPPNDAFSLMSYPVGRFVSGNLYLYAVTFDGIITAQGERPGLINSNAWEHQDEKGLYINQEIVKKLKMTTDGVWVTYISKRAEKKTYAEKVIDNNGKEYFIACGYYPDANREETIGLVRKGYQFMKSNGRTSAIEEFTSRRSDAYRYGDLFLIVHDMQGKVIADGQNVDNMGRNDLNVKDEDGFEYIKSMLNRATKEGIWVNSKVHGSFKSIYAQKIDLGVGQFVISCSYYPVSKAETMILLVQSGASFLEMNPRERAFERFTTQDGTFRRGDLQLVVVDSSGLCYAYGDDTDLIWRNIFKVVDDKKRQFIKIFIDEAQRGATVVQTHMNNALKYNYIMPVEKEGRTYIVSSGFYQ